jgi:hypothetical protein
VNSIGGKNTEAKVIDGQEYLSLQVAAKNTPHSQEYLRLLASQKKLQARKLGRNWYTTRAALASYFGSAFVPDVVSDTLSAPVSVGTPAIAPKKPSFGWRKFLEALLVASSVAYLAFFAIDARNPGVVGTQLEAFQWRSLAPWLFWGTKPKLETVVIEAAATPVPKVQSAIAGVPVAVAPTRAQVLDAVTQFFCRRDSCQRCCPVARLAW